MAGEQGYAADPKSFRQSEIPGKLNEKFMENSLLVHTPAASRSHPERMSKPTKHNRSVLAFTVFCLSFATLSCGDKGDPLPGGYFIFIASSSEMILNEPKYGGSILELGTDLEEIGNHNEFIFGRSGADRGAAPGYFLLNTTSGSIKTGLAEKDWLAELTAVGIPTPPKLVDPSRKSPRRQ
jgi:hypothetical protein